MADQLTRRTTLAGAAGLTLAVPLLAACGDGSGAETATTPTSAPTSPSAPSTPAGTATSPAAPAGDPLTPVDAIQVGGGKVFSEQNVVVTQPEAGTFKAFDATCTHQGCQVSKVADGTIECTCHFSRFSIEDGSVEGGPAPEPLPEVAITVADGEIYLT